ncbi:MAG: hypothetical protein CBC24_01780 [Candidatus Pelagibacter sp. TMED64]|nr:hypothetical protein [Gammaproteobacteria bacterium]OUU67149.1 MAG: hypothetical protein CBC24_01780 [Candidatus Pelagibacter sp. TMED64]|tara:strand:+ start:202 stop:876 length:675 start_codon:yes stop_codon:yes gene_type:complete
MDQEIVALIPVREGSQRVKNKNFRPFAKEKSLMHLKIRQLKEANCFDSIYVSSDSELAKEIAESEGINFLYRDPYMCGHESRLYEYNNYMLNTIPGNPVVAWTMVTAPLYQDYALAIEAYKNNSNEYDSLMSVIKYDDFLVDQNAKPINCAFGHWHLLTQELREAYQLTGGIYMAPKDKQLEWSYWFGPKPYMHEISKIESMDVDDQQDFEICELFHLNKNGEA